VVVRTDLSAPQIAVQSTHAMIEIARSSLLGSNLEHPSVILCGVINEDKLQQQLNFYQSQGIICKPFYEADLDNQLTAFATEPIFGEQRKLFKRLQLCKSSDFVKGGAA
jgi:hypothetical protein